MGSYLVPMFIYIEGDKFYWESSAISAKVLVTLADIAEFSCNSEACGGTSLIHIENSLTYLACLIMLWAAKLKNWLMKWLLVFYYFEILQILRIYKDNIIKWWIC